jgi:hypothetical protein
MRNNPGKTLTIYDKPGIVRDGLPLADTPTNIMSGVRVIGHIFTGDEFFTSAVIDRPNPESANNDDTHQDPTETNQDEITLGEALESSREDTATTTHSGTPSFHISYSCNTF